MIYSIRHMKFSSSICGLHMSLKEYKFASVKYVWRCPACMYAPKCSCSSDCFSLGSLSFRLQNFIYLLQYSCPCMFILTWSIIFKINYGHLNITGNLHKKWSYNAGRTTLYDQFNRKNKSLTGNVCDWSDCLKCNYITSFAFLFVGKLWIMPVWWLERQPYCRNIYRVASSVTLSLFPTLYLKYYFEIGGCRTMLRLLEVTVL